MELQIPKGTEPQKNARNKPLETPPPAPAAAASSNKPPPPPATARLQDPTPPHTSTSLAEQHADRGNAGEQRKEGEWGGAEQKGPKPQASETTSVGPSSATAIAAAAGAATDLQKKRRRAERFGMPVLLTEEEKRNSRAKRFGTGSTLHGIQNAGQVEEQKRKARAERFGLKAHSPVDEEAKKKARLERFAPNSKTATAEEEKRNTGNQIFTNIRHLSSQWQGQL
ncbi:uncharacterized protein [Elaeis guineensis]|uniref:uncharacterized protein n=1 Tax=Elaeis guineensis var. tenera TaxID=51953 RepID=UPI003C6DA6E3